MEEIYEYSFRKKPDYKKLKFLMEREILLLNEIPYIKYDWNEEEKNDESLDIIENINDNEIIIPSNTDEYHRS